MCLMCLSDMTPLTIVRHLLEDTYDYASTSIQAPDEIADFIMEWGRLNIPDDVLAEDGRENHPHVTVKYGLTTRDLPPELSEIAKTTKPFPIFMGVISLFTTNPKHDVVKIDVESPVLRALNKRVSGAIPHEDAYPTYHPHLTVAYVQKGTCGHLDGDDPFKPEGVAHEFTAYGMTYSAPGDEEDAARLKTALLFSKGDRPDPAVEEEAAIDSLPVPDPFGGIGFPADPYQTKQFLRSSGKRRGERPIL